MYIYIHMLSYQMNFKFQIFKFFLMYHECLLKNVSISSWTNHRQLANVCLKLNNNICGKFSAKQSSSVNNFKYFNTYTPACTTVGPHKTAIDQVIRILFRSLTLWLLKKKYLSVTFS